MTTVLLFYMNNKSVWPTSSAEGILLDYFDRLFIADARPLGMIAGRGVPDPTLSPPSAGGHGRRRDCSFTRQDHRSSPTAASVALLGKEIGQRLAGPLPVGSVADKMRTRGRSRTSGRHLIGGIQASGWEPEHCGGIRSLPHGSGRPVRGESYGHDGLGAEIRAPVRTEVLRV